MKRYYFGMSHQVPLKGRDETLSADAARGRDDTGPVEILRSMSRFGAVRTMTPQRELADVIRNYQDMIYRIVFVYCKNHYDAEDITQEVFFKYLKNQAYFEDEGHIKAWLIRVAVNASKSLLRSAWRRKTASLDEHGSLLQDERNAAGAEQFDEALDSRPAVYSAVLELPKKYRSVVMLYYYDDYPVADIAKMLGRSESSVQTQLYRARAMLKKSLKEEWQDE